MLEMVYKFTLFGLVDRPVMERVMGFKNEVVMPQPIDEMSLSWSEQVENTLYVCLELHGSQSRPKSKPSRSLLRMYLCFLLAIFFFNLYSFEYPKM